MSLHPHTIYSVTSLASSFAPPLLNILVISPVEAEVDILQTIPAIFNDTRPRPHLSSYLWAD